MIQDKKPHRYKESEVKCWVLLQRKKQTWLTANAEGCVDSSWELIVIGLPNENGKKTIDCV